MSACLLVRPIFCHFWRRSHRRWLLLCLRVLLLFWATEHFRQGYSWCWLQRPLFQSFEFSCITSMQGALRRRSRRAKGSVSLDTTDPAWPARGLLGLPAGAVAHVLY